MKNLSTLVFILVLFFLVALTGYNYFRQPFLKKFSVQQQEIAEVIPTPTLSQKQLLVEKLSTRQKVAQLMAISVTLAETSDEAIQATLLNWIAQQQPGFVTFFGQKISLTETQNAVKQIEKQYADSQLKPLFVVDHEGGTVQRLSGEGFSKLPSWKEVCEVPVETADEIFTQSAQELQTAGINIVLAPVVDIASNSAVLRTRTCGEYEPMLETAESYILAFSQYHIMPVLKHFPGIGNSRRDLHQQFENILLDVEDSTAFKALLDRYPNIGLMSSHVGLVKVMENTPCSLSKACLGRMTQLYPQAIFFTDALEMKSARYQDGSDELKPLPQVAVEAVLAGNDVLIWGEDVGLAEMDTVLDRLEVEYSDSEEFRQRVDQSLEKIMSLKKIDVEL